MTVTGGNPADAMLGIHGFTDAVEIGRGSFGVVYRAHQPAVGRDVAIKILTVGSGGSTDRFDRERNVLGALSGHPAIVTVFDSGYTEAGQPYVVMELMGGGSLGDRIATTGPIPWQQAVETGVRIAGGLEVAHRMGVLHRDVKPDNLLISNYGDVKLADFGVATFVGGASSRAWSVIASVAYAAPEVLGGARSTVSSDVYGLAATTFAFLCGHAPFARATDDSVLPMVTRILTDRAPDLRPLGVPNSVCLVLERAMEKDAGARYPSAQAFGAALQDAQRALGVPVTTMVIDPNLTALPPHDVVTAGPPPPTGDTPPAVNPSAVPPPVVPAPVASGPLPSPPSSVTPPPPAPPVVSPPPSSVTPPPPAPPVVSPPPSSVTPPPPPPLVVFPPPSVTPPPPPPSSSVTPAPPPQPSSVTPPPPPPPSPLPAPATPVVVPPITPASETKTSPWAPVSETETASTPAAESKADIASSHAAGAAAAAAALSLSAAAGAHEVDKSPWAPAAKSENLAPAADGEAEPQESDDSPSRNAAVPPVAASPLEQTSTAVATPAATPPPPPPAPSFTPPPPPPPAESLPPLPPAATSSGASPDDLVPSKGERPTQATPKVSAVATAATAGVAAAAATEVFDAGPVLADMVTGKSRTENGTGTRWRTVAAVAAGAVLVIGSGVLSYALVSHNNKNSSKHAAAPTTVLPTIAPTVASTIASTTSTTPTTAVPVTQATPATTATTAAPPATQATTPPPPPPPPAPTVSLSGPTSIEDNVGVIYRASTTNASSGTWSLTGGPAVNLHSTAWQPGVGFGFSAGCDAVGATYTLTLHANGPGGSSSGSISFSVHDTNGSCH